MLQSYILSLLALAYTIRAAAAPNITNGLALTPPMGWSSWNNFGDNINEGLIKQTIDAMDGNSLREAGFIYVNLDDGWQHYKGDRKDHVLEADPVKFPSGIKSLADYAHGKGFKLGIYSGPGGKTCAGYTGSENHEAEDAAMFASWGIDHLKYDSCCSHHDASQEEVQKVALTMSEALINQTHPIVYHICHCGWVNVWEWAASEGGNQWRIGQDISDDFNYPGNREKYYFDVLDMLDRGNNLTQYAGPGHWNDYDMLIVGLNGESAQLQGPGASNVEYRAHFSMWAMVTSPLLIGADARTLSNETIETFTNKEIIEISQDPKGAAAEVVREDPGVGGTLQAYAKEMSDGSFAVALFNRGSSTADMSISPRRDLTVPWNTYWLRDVWKHKDHGPYDITYTTEVMSHEAKILRMYPITTGP